ncbi:FMN-linked oxidoreductase [Cubamyces sp. BRFM 1775]|nr:FMN-linked oxidoreductase [Cubamyces sp. BRFM 1775]
MVKIHTLNIEPPVVNASCAWASDYEQLLELYDSPYTGAVITRTATFNGFSEDASNTVAFAKETVTSVNSYGYSPHPLSTYLDWVYTLLTTPCLDGSPPTKPVIISITASTPTVLTEMVENIQTLRKKLRAAASTSTSNILFAPNIDPATLVGIELNTSCPNIKDAPPPSYTFPLLLPLLDVLSSAFYADPSLTIGLKLPPYLYATRFAEAVRFIHTYTREIRPAVFMNGNSHQLTEADGNPMRSLNPFAYLASTNTLGNCLLFSEQAFRDPADFNQGPEASADGMLTDDFYARGPSPSPPLSSPGGMGGEAIHPISLGNVYTFARMLAAHPDPAVRRIRVIGIGGVTSSAAAARMRAAGASVVGCATLLGREGVRAFEIIAGHS